MFWRDVSWMFQGFVGFFDGFFDGFVGIFWGGSRICFGVLRFFWCFEVFLFLRSVKSTNQKVAKIL